MLEYFFRHYEGWVDRFFILDDGSTDGTQELLAMRPDVELGRITRSDPSSWVVSAKAIYDNDWKRSRGEADWVVVTNIDEHLHHPEMRRYLSALPTDVTAVASLGYQMLAEKPPPADGLLWRDCPMGAPWKNMSKVGIFKPDAIRESNFAPGRHAAAFDGTAVYPERDEVVNLHYKYVWGLDATHERHGEQRKRLGEFDDRQGWAHKYRWSKEELGEDFKIFERGLVDTRAIDHHAVHPEPRWWRQVR